MHEYVTAQQVAARCHKATQHGESWMATCPAHEDRRESLKISAGRKGTIMYCHAGCDIDDICAAIGLNKRQLFYDYRAEGPVTTTNVRQIMEQMEKDYQPAPIESSRKVDLVMWDALVSDKLDKEVWVKAMAMAGVQYPWLMRLEYEEAMVYSVIFKDGPLWAFLRPLWEVLERPNWHTLASHAFTKMAEVYREEYVT